MWKSFANINIFPFEKSLALDAISTKIILPPRVKVLNKSLSVFDPKISIQRIWLRLQSSRPGERTGFKARNSSWRSCQALKFNSPAGIIFPEYLPKETSRQADSETLFSKIQSLNCEPNHLRGRARLPWIYQLMRFRSDTSKSER